MAQTLLQQRWLSLAQGERYSGYTDRTLRNWEAAGLLKFYRIVQPGSSRGSVRIDRLELDRLIERSVAPPASMAMNDPEPTARRKKTLAEKRKAATATR
jgi:hypothetical protein